MVFGPGPARGPQRAAAATLGELALAGLIFILEIGAAAAPAASSSLVLIAVAVLLRGLLTVAVAATVGPRPRLCAWATPPLALAAALPFAADVALAPLAPIVAAVWSAALLRVTAGGAPRRGPEDAPRPLPERLAATFAATAAAALLLMAGVALGRSEGAQPTALQVVLVVAGVPVTVGLAALTGGLVGLGLRRDLLGTAHTLDGNSGQPSAPIRVTRDDRLGAIQAALEAQRVRLLDALARHAEAIARLREANTAKVELIATLSHDLRSSLTTILGHVQLLEDPPRPLSADDSADLQAIHQLADELLRQLRGLVDVSMIETGQLHLDLAPTDLDALLSEAIAEHSARAHARGLAIRRRAKKGHLPRLHADAPRLRQALDVLLDNAIDFSEAGTIEVWASVREERRLDISVRDPGVGIAAEELEAIFKPYRRIREESPRRGLGLAIARAIADCHGGALRVRSTLGEGSTFTIALPLKPTRRRSALDLSALALRIQEASASLEASVADSGSERAA
ncbi:MAG: HAMP domain-containing sensor histidine kinase [Nannocystaceae bacterium]